jgi:ABC-type transporter Mla subunit MlaD
VEPVSILAIVALIAATTLCGVGVWAAIEIARTAREVRGSVGQTTERMVPLLDKADVTVDAVNAELLRVDAIITQFEDAGAKVSHASGTISEIVNAPAEIVSEVADRVRKAWKDRKRAAESAAGDVSIVTIDDSVAGDSPEPDPQYQTED